MKRFADELRRLRCERRMTQQELAGQVGLSKAYVSALEVGRKPAPPLGIVHLLCEALDVTTDRLWRLARTERATRLEARIEGTPAAARNRRNADSGLLEEIAHAVQQVSGEQERAEMAAKLRELAAALERASRTGRNRDGQ